ncbi:hypothetical protein HHI36_010241 [Cryptolaemus montrouzieri]|uniref:Uncharacterized protein n=1 Tax=Cryptolaemus montrouzieri TaxID=559131 RepID=A0ABD2MI49_9CUCU
MVKCTNCKSANNKFNTNYYVDQQPESSISKLPKTGDFENPDKIDTSVFDSINDYNEMVALRYFNNFRLYHNNIRNINKNFEQLLVLLSGLKHRPDCIILSETFHIYDLDIFNIDGYDLVFNEDHYNQQIITVIKCFFHRNITRKQELLEN